MNTCNGSSDIKFLSDLSCSNFIKQKFIFLKNNYTLPNLLISGPPGSGKSTTVDVFTHEIFGKERENLVLKLNASDNRGIDVIRNKIKDFCKKKIISKEFGSQAWRPGTSKSAKTLPGSLPGALPVALPYN